MTILNIQTFLLLILNGVLLGLSELHTHKLLYVNFEADVASM